MVRSEPERLLDRKFVRIETWSELLVRWDAVDTEQEAVGLLYAGTSIPSSCPGVGWSEELQEVKKRLRFYLLWASHKNETVATTAQQLIVKCWLVRPPLYGEGSVEIVRLLLEFLQEPKPALLSPPYPRFVARYLLPTHSCWRHGSYPEHKRGADYNMLQPFTELVVTALLSWGLGYVLAVDGLRPDVIAMIECFLAKSGYDSGRVFMEMSGYGEPLENLSKAVSADEINKRATRAFLKLQYWVGEGVRAKLERRVPHRHS